MSSNKDNIFLSLADTQFPYADPFSAIDNLDTVSRTLEPPILQGIVASESASGSSTFLSETFGIDWNSPISSIDATDTKFSSSSNISDDSMSQYSSSLWSLYHMPQDRQAVPSTYLLGSHDLSDFIRHFPESVPMPQTEDELFQTNNSDAPSGYPQPVGEPGTSSYTQPAPASKQMIDVGTQTERQETRKITRRKVRNVNAKPEYICTLCSQAMRDKHDVIERHKRSMMHNQNVFKVEAKRRAQKYGENELEVYNTLWSQFEAGVLACFICSAKFYGDRTDALIRHMKTYHS